MWYIENEFILKMDKYYALQSEIPATVGLSSYRTKDDISYKTTKSIQFERIDETSYETGPFVNGAHIVGTFTKADKTYKIDNKFAKISISSSNKWYSSFTESSTTYWIR